MSHVCSADLLPKTVKLPICLLADTTMPITAEVEHHIMLKCFLLVPLIFTMNEHCLLGFFANLALLQFPNLTSLVPSSHTCMNL